MNSVVEARGGEILLYEAQDGEVRAEVRLARDTVWLTQQQMAELFGRERSVITKQLRNLFSEGVLDQNCNVQNLHKFKPKAKEPLPARSTTTTST